MCFLFIVSGVSESLLNAKTDFQESFYGLPANAGYPITTVSTSELEATLEQLIVAS